MSEINSSLQKVKWEEEMENKGVNQSWRFFKSKIEEVVKNNVPLKEKRKQQPKPPWQTKRVCRSVKKQTQLWKRYERTGRNKEYEEYKKQRNKNNQMRKKAKREYEKKLLKRFKDKPKLFYSYVRNKQKVKPEIPQLNTGDGIMTSSDEEIAQEFGKKFGSVFTRETDNENNYPEFESRMHGNNILQNVRITENDVCEKLKRLKEDKACGPDGIHPKLLKECAEIIAIPLYLIFSKSLESGVVPADWKLANVSPIHKKGSRAMASNYRPVSLTCLASKLMESIIRDAMVRHLLENDLCTTAQHGFTNGRSCLTNLLETFESWTEDVDKGYSVDVIFLDFQKAFDKVPKKRLLQKLSAYGIEGKVLCWIEDFLSDRRMRIMVRGEYSEWVDVISGVPQGSVLGPILFLIYVNDIPEMVNCSIKMFADDTKLFRTVKSIDDCNILQNDLDTLSQWTNEWLLSFNVDKCKVMHIGKNNPKLEYTMRTENENKILIETREEKDLKWCMDNKWFETWEASYRSFTKSYDGTSLSKKSICSVWHWNVQYYLHNVYKTAFGILYPSLGTILCKRYIIIGESPKKSHQTGVGTKRFIVWRKIRKIKIIQPRRTEITWWFNTDFQIINWERKCRLWNLI